MGSAATGLGFFQVEVLDINDQHLGAGKNVGIVYVEAGQVIKEELAHNFSLIYKTNWPWHIRKLDSWTYLVKFPPHISVAQVAGYPNFGLPEMEGVTVNVEEWKGDLEHHAELHTVWLQLTGVAPKWAEWAVVEQFASILGTLVDVDWQGNFKSFFEVVRIQIRCKDYTKIPANRIFGIGSKLYKIGITVEPPVEEDLSDDLLDDKTDKDTETEAGKGAPAVEEHNSHTKNGSGPASRGNSTGTCNNSGTGGCTRQTVLSFLQNLQDLIFDAHSCQLLQEMELGEEDEEEIFNTMVEESGETPIEDDEDVVPCCQQPKSHSRENNAELGSYTSPKKEQQSRCRGENHAGNSC